MEEYFGNHAEMFLTILVFPIESKAMLYGRKHFINKSDYGETIISVI